MRCKFDDLTNESDVEQKLLWPLLTDRAPLGLGFDTAEVATKRSIRAIPIEKGKSKKLYFPDYAIILCGLPVVIIEAKEPGGDIDEALREASLYAHELNRRFPPDLNPCNRVIACNGAVLATCAWDADSPDLALSFDELNLASTKLEQLATLCGRAAQQSRAHRIVQSLVTRPLFMPLAILGGRSVRDDEVGHNTFGARLALDFKHVFNPQTLEERAFIAKNAYVRSLRRDRYVEPIDRLIRAASPPSVSDARLIEDTAKPAEVIAALRRHKSLEHQVLLLVGGVGAGKTTFVDYISEVALAADVRSNTIWVRIDLNYAPLSEAEAYQWFANELIACLQKHSPQSDFDAIETAQLVLAVEIQKLRKGPLKLLSPTSEAYKLRWVDGVQALINDRMLFAKALARYLCAGTKLLIVALDNCDKRTRDEQLRMFQIAQWAQREFRCLIFLPIRDVTYDHHRQDAPLNTALKDLVFRIEPPQFARVLQRRVTLALTEMMETTGNRTLSYDLPNGIRVEYPRSDQGMYLACILTSLYEHDKLIRRTITGLAGRDIRRAMEIFLEFCTSAHINESEIYKIRHAEGRHALPYSVVARVLLRMNRRFYEGDRSYIKNLFQCNPPDSYPDHFCRIAILRWLHSKLAVRGPTGIRGYHQVRQLLADLVPIGHEIEATRREINYLVINRCILTEHQRSDSVLDDDLICLSPAGSVHLDLIKNVDYLAACGEELWYDQEGTAGRVAERIGRRGIAGHYTRMTTLSNAEELVGYLESRESSGFPCADAFIESSGQQSLHSVDTLRAAVRAAQQVATRRIFVGNLPFKLDVPDVDAWLSAHGTVVSVDLPLHADGRRRGFAYAEVAPTCVASMVAALNGAVLDGRTIEVRPA